MHAPVRPLRGRWPSTVERRLSRYFYLDPAVIVDDDVSADDFRRAMFGIYVGGTIKITWAGRHLDADRLLLDHVDLSGARIADIGASDGSTSVDLVRVLPDDFGSFTISDLYLELTWARSGGRTYLFDQDDTCVLVSGSRYAAWPQLSPWVERLFRRGVDRARRARRGTCLLLNPEARELLKDPRVAYREHDIFTPWPGEPLDVVKTANLLRRLYFSDEQLTEALRAVHASLVDDGHLLLADSSRTPGEPPAGGLYRRTPAGFELVAAGVRRPEIHDLVEQVVMSPEA
ncbi:hypothetical protein IF650_10060 [Cellulosimicrobium terreum]|nr:hypothetical protein [Cellulosimicrobium terreum]